MMTSVHGFFNMLTETDMERYRAETFLTKEPETIAWINDMKPGEVLYDVGANVGVYTLYAASRGVKVVAIEPVLENYVRLVRNIEANGFDKIVLPLYAAAGACPWDDIFEMTTVSIDDNQAGASGAQAESKHGKIIRDIPVVPLGRIGHMCSLWPDHIKIDVDGRERHVLQGANIDDPKSYLIEINPPWSKGGAQRMLGRTFTTDNKYNTMTPHSRERRQRGGIAAENVIFTRR